MAVVAHKKHPTASPAIPVPALPPLSLTQQVCLACLILDGLTSVHSVTASFLIPVTAALSLFLIPPTAALTCGGQGPPLLLLLCCQPALQAAWLSWTPVQATGSEGEV